MGIIISLLIMWLMFKILQWAFSSLSDSNNDKETSNHDNGAIDSNSNEEPSNHDVGTIDSSNDKETASQTVEAIDSNNDHETSNHDDVAIDNEPSDLKYDNEVYISFRNKVRKAYESLKKSEYRISWGSDMDGFVIVENDSLLIGDTIYVVNVRHDDQKLLELNDPFYIVVSYGIIFDIRYYNDYKEKADYLNDCETIKPNIYYSVDTIKGTNFGKYYANIVATNNKKICEDTEELGEAELFKRLMDMAKQAWYEGQEIYGDKEASSHDVGAIDNELSDLKYDNEVYISLRNIVRKAYESYKKSGYNITWNPNIDGFIILEDGSLSAGSSTYIVHVNNDHRNLYTDDPYCIVVAYGILFERSNNDDYEEKVEYLNNYLYTGAKRPGISYSLSTLEDDNLGAFYCNVAISNDDSCKRMKELGEAELFKRLMREARAFCYGGQDLYSDKVLRGEKNSSN